MRALTLKSIPDALYRRLKQSAKAHRRSINGEAIFRLERSLGAGKVDPEDVLTRLQGLRKRFTGPRLTERLLRQARQEGRP